MGTAAFVGLVGIQRGVNAAEHHVRAARASGGAQFVAAPCVPRVNADADDVPCANARRIESLQRLVNQDWLAVFGRGRRREHIQPPRRDDANAERHVASIDEVNRHYWSGSYNEAIERGGWTFGAPIHARWKALDG